MLRQEAAIVIGEHRGRVLLLANDVLINELFNSRILPGNSGLRQPSCSMKRPEAVQATWYCNFAIGISSWRIGKQKAVADHMQWGTQPRSPQG